MIICLANFLTFDWPEPETAVCSRCETQQIFGTPHTPKMRLTWLTRISFILNSLTYLHLLTKYFYRHLQVPTSRILTPHKLRMGGTTGPTLPWVVHGAINILLSICGNFMYQVLKISTYPMNVLSFTFLMSLSLILLP